MHFAAGAKPTAGQMNDVAHSGINMLDEQVLETNQLTVTFTDIDQSYKNLWIIISGGITGTQFRDIQGKFNDASDYTVFRTARTGDGTFDEQFFGSNGGFLIGRLPNGSIQGNINTISYGYSRTDRNKFLEGSFAGISGSASTGTFVGQAVNVWNSTAAITKIELLQPAGESILAGSIFQLYGLGGRV